MKLLGILIVAQDQRSPWGTIIQTILSLPKRLAIILRNPSESRQELAILLVAVVILFLLIITTIFLATTIVDARRRQKALKKRIRRRLTPAQLLARRIVLGTVIAVAFSAISYFSFFPRSCASCHEIKKQYDSWRTSTHARVNCIHCHSKPGVLGYLSTGVRALTHLGVHAGLIAKQGTVYYEPSSCFTCHEYIVDHIAEGTVRTRHKDFIESDWSCSRCHKGVGHKVQRVFSMRYCLECHDGKQATAKCEDCHLKDIHLARLKKEVPEEAPKVSAGPIRCYNVCHPKEVDALCTPCHGVEMPHPREFIARHAQYSYNNPALCVRCHEERGATTARQCGCHPPEDTMHGTYESWFILHRTQARAGDPSTNCLCHYSAFAARDICDFCHLEGSPLRRWQQQAQQSPVTGF